jgi:hypothetical protein
MVGSGCEGVTAFGLVVLYDSQNTRPLAAGADDKFGALWRETNLASTTLTVRGPREKMPL